MDGPSVNWKFFRLLQEDENCQNIIDIGSCGLHVLSGALQTGHKETGWAVNDFLHGIYYLFNDSPARRGAFSSTTGCTKFPLKFCKIRWVENVNVCNRALEVFNEIKKWLEHKDTKLPGNISIKNVRKGVKDALTPAKVSFFSLIAGILEPFLKKYQTAQPMIPFLYDDLIRIILELLKKFVKPVILETGIKNILKLEWNKAENFLPLEKLDVGFATRKYLKDSNISGKDQILFLKDCQKFLIGTVKIFFERCSLKYKLIKTITCLNPKTILEKSKSEDNAKNMIGYLFDKNIITSELAEKSRMQYSELLFNSDFLLACQNYSSTIRLDKFYFNWVGCNNQYPDLWIVIKHILILSHGNAAVESGFSVNKNILVENMLENSLIAQRRIYDSVKNDENGLMNFEITKEMRKYVKNSHQRYKEALDINRKLKQTTDNKATQKRKSESEIYLLENKKRKLERDTSASLSVIDLEIAELRKNI